jgi:hypothetical protein
MEFTKYTRKIGVVTNGVKNFQSFIYCENDKKRYENIKGNNYEEQSSIQAQHDAHARDPDISREQHRRECETMQGNDLVGRR